jgi:hypothetical protein
LESQRALNVSNYVLQVNQAIAWFDKEVTVVWINSVIWPWHLQQHGNVHCLLLLDNCTAHTNLDKSKLPHSLSFTFSPQVVHLFSNLHNRA